MPIYLGNKKLTCGYFGTVPLAKTMFGKDTVCTSCSKPFPEFPAPDSSARFSMMIKSSIDLMPSWANGVGLDTLILSSSAYYTTSWALYSRGTDKDGNFDYELTSTATITMLKFARNKSHILNIQIAKAVDHNRLPTKCSYYYAFNQLPNLKTFQVLPSIGASTNLCRMFWDNKNLEYVDLPKSFFGTTPIDHERMFMDTPKLKFISYLDTRHTITRVGMFQNSNPLRPSADEREALFGAWGSRFQFDTCRMSSNDSWKKSDKTKYLMWQIDFGNKEYGGNHHSSAVEIYAYSSEDGNEQLAASRHELSHFESNQSIPKYPSSNLIDRDLSTYYLSYHWGNGHYGWTYKVPQAFDSFRLRSYGHTHTNAGETAGHAMGRDFIVMARNSTGDPWVTLFTHRVMDAGNYGNWENDENRTILVPD